MSRVRTNSSIDEVDQMARQAGIENLVVEGEGRRSFQAFGRVFEISEAPPGKVGLFSVVSKPKDDPDAAPYSGMETHDRIRHLFRRAVKWRERVA